MEDLFTVAAAAEARAAAAAPPANLPAPPAAWGSIVEVETRRRIHVAAAAYAYEIEGSPIMPDATFDEMCRQVDLAVDTTRPEMDVFFRAEFSPDTGMWVHIHPDKPGLARLAARLRADCFT
jgi:hypothetical protein